MGKQNDIMIIVNTTNDDLIYLLRIHYLETSKESKLDLVRPVLVRIKANLNNLIGIVKGMSDNELNFLVPFITKQEIPIIEWLNLTNANVVNIVGKM